MRVLALVQNYPPERGGVRYIPDLFAALATRGHQLQVITGIPHYPQGRVYAGFHALRPSVRCEEGVEVVRVPLVPASNRQLAWRVAGFCTFGLTALLAGILVRQPDVVITSVPPVTVMLAGLLLARFRRVPQVLLLQDVEPHASLVVRRRAHTAWGRWLVRQSVRLYRQATCLVVPDASQVDELGELGVPRNAVHALIHAIDLPRFRAQAAAHPVEASRRPGRYLAIYAGTLGVMHEVPALIDVFTAPAVRALPFDLLLVGDGECAEECRQRIAARGLDHVTLRPPVPLEQFPALLGAADLLVCSQQTNVRGIKMPSYLAAGKPILAHGASGAARLVREARAGWTVALGDAAGVAEALACFVADPVGALARGRCARAYAEQHLNWQPQVNAWEGLLEGLVRARAERGVHSCLANNRICHTESRDAKLLRRPLRPAARRLQE